MLAVVGAVQGLLLLTSGAASASTACPGDERIPTAATAPSAASALVCDINAIRGRHDLKPLRWNDTVAQPAQSHASDMAAHGFLSHTSSDGRGPMARIAATGYFDGWPAQLVLENVEWGSYAYATPLATAIGWMKSDDHRAHLLDPQAQDIGVGVAQGPLTAGGVSGAFYVAVFAARGTVVRSAKLKQRRRACSVRSKRHRLQHKHCRRKARV